MEYLCLITKKESVHFRVCVIESLTVASALTNFCLLATFTSFHLALPKLSQMSSFVIVELILSICAYAGFHIVTRVSDLFSCKCS